MKYIYGEADEAIEQIAYDLNLALSAGSVLWLLSGGSNIYTAVKIREKIEIDNPLTVGLVDERYVPEGHSDSNWTKLMNAGFNTMDVALMPVLQPKPIDQTANSYKERLAKAFGEHETILGIFGMGADGHTAGILPNSPATEAKELVTHFEGPDFKRITTTPLAFKNFDKAYLVAYGANKREPLQQLTGEVPLKKQPAQALKLAKELVIYTDQFN